MKWMTEMLKKLDQTKWLVLGLCGILLLVIALPAGESDRTETDTVFDPASGDGADADPANQIYKKQLTRELEQALACMAGVGEVRVMITFKDSGEAVVEKDVTKSVSGQNDNGQNSQYQESAIYQETDGREPYVSQQLLPAVEGVLIVAQGGGDSGVKQEMRDAVMALFPIGVHKIKIVKMQDS